MTYTAARIATYVALIEAEYRRGLATEHSYRPALKSFLEDGDAVVAAVNDPKRVAAGAPDFAVVRDTAHGPLTIGHVETKDLGANLSVEERSEQLRRYRDALENLILTDYVEFRWYRQGDLVDTVRLAEVEKSALRHLPRADDDLGRLITQFLAHAPAAVADARELAERLAKLTHLLADSIGITLSTGSSASLLPELRQAVEETLVPDMSDQEFADMFAQTLAYGLFAARANHAGPAPFRRQDAAREIPKSNPFLRRLFDAVTGVELDAEPYVSLVDDLAQLLALADMDSVFAQFGKGRRDPIIHFYESFLAAYDPKLREARGVYYTPEPVVSYLVESAGRLLGSAFGIKEGFADTSETTYQSVNDKGELETRASPRVLVLDPACGTGTFLYSVIASVRDEFAARGDAGLWGPYVREQLLPRLFGFELLMAPYAVAHLKLGMQLDGRDLPVSDRADWVVDLGPADRLGVYLTNSLEEAIPKSAVLLGGYISDEANSAAEIKRELPILIVIGNPPYSGQSANRSWRTVDVQKKTRSGKRRTIHRREKTFIGRLLDDYYRVDGGPLGERNPKWLQDDYVKFIRFGQWRVETTGSGILAFVTNHSYLDNPTFRGMRQQLQRAFSEVYILDLHGSSAKREKTPSGDKDENVFDIRRGVAMTLFVRRPHHEGQGRTFHADLWGRRSDKYEWLSAHDIESTKWTEIHPESPDYLFVPADLAMTEEWRSGHDLAAAMPVNSVGIVTSRDDLVFDFESGALRKKIAEFVDPSRSDADIRRAFFRKNSGDRPAGDSSAWSLSAARSIIRSDADWPKAIVDCQYRPFDTRPLLWHRGAIERGRWKVMRHMVDCENVALISARTNKSPEPDHFFVTANPSEAKAGEATTQSYIFPLYLCDRPAADGQLTIMGEVGGEGHSANFSPQYLVSVEKTTTLRLGEALSPAQLFDYQYALFYSRGYRTRYAPFLRREFPRVFLTSNIELFHRLTDLGGQLRRSHLLQGAARASYPIPGSDVVEPGFPQYVTAGEHARFLGPEESAQARVYINGHVGARGQFFTPVTEDAWKLTVGGYQVADKWLRDRVGRQLSAEDVTHYARTLASLELTVRVVGEIDQAITDAGGWPLG